MKDLTGGENEARSEPRSVCCVVPQPKLKTTAWWSTAATRRASCPQRFQCSLTAYSTVDRREREREREGYSRERMYYVEVIHIFYFRFRFFVMRLFVGDYEDAVVKLITTFHQPELNVWEIEQVVSFCGGLL